MRRDRDPRWARGAATGALALWRGGSSRLEMWVLVLVLGSRCVALLMMLDYYCAIARSVGAALAGWWDRCRCCFSRVGRVDVDARARTGVVLRCVVDDAAAAAASRATTATAISESVARIEQ